MKKNKYFVHPRGICETKHIGRGSTVWAFTHILPGARIGNDVNVCDHVFIENDVIVGNRVTIKSMVALWNGLRIEDDVFIGPSVAFTNDRYPRSKKSLASHPLTIIKQGASIGAGATILPGIVIGAYAMVAAGAVVAKDVAPFEMVLGTPARRKGFVCKCGFPLLKTGRILKCTRSGWKGLRPTIKMVCDR